MLLYTAVADADLTNTEASAALTAAGVSSIGYVGFKRYVRATAVTAAMLNIKCWCILR